MDNLIPIDKRAKQFAIRIVKLYQYLVDERHEKVMSGLKVRMKKEEGIRALALCGLLPFSFFLLPLSLALYCRAHFAEAHLISLFPGEATSSSLHEKSTNSTLLPSSFSLLPLLRSLTGFFSWSILGAIANMLKQQGLNVLLNLFFGMPSLPRRSLGEVGNPHCRVQLLICRERDALTACARQFFEPLLLPSYRSRSQFVTLNNLRCKFGTSSFPCIFNQNLI